MYCCRHRKTSIKTKTTGNLWNLGEVGCRLGRPPKYPWFSVFRGAVPCERDYQDTKVTVYVHLWERCQETPLNSILTRQSKSKSTLLAFLWSKSTNIYYVIIISIYIQALNISVYQSINQSLSRPSRPFCGSGALASSFCRRGLSLRIGFKMTRPLS